MRNQTLVLALALAVGAGSDAAARADAGGRWQKGQTHAHSGNSGDSRTPPLEVARWYAARGYDFLVFTDHNVVTTLPPVGRLLVAGGAELTQNLRTCDPPPPDGMHCLIHMNALFAQKAPPAPPGRIEFPITQVTSLRRIDLYQRELDAARALGALTQLNHPNFMYGADAALVTELGARGLVLVEIANQSVDANNAGDAAHPPVEAAWDAALSAGRTVWGVATDDAHHYDDAAGAAARGERVYTGDRGFVMVRARHDLGAIRDAMARGDFYASNGVLLDDVRVAGGALAVDVAKTAAAPVMTTFIGQGGRELARVSGLRPRYRLADAPAGPAGYVRAVVVDARGRRAWVQPVRTPGPPSTGDRKTR